MTAIELKKKLFKELGDEESPYKVFTINLLEGVKGNISVRNCDKYLIIGENEFLELIIDILQDNSKIDHLIEDYERRLDTCYDLLENDTMYKDKTNRNRARVVSKASVYRQIIRDLKKLK